MVRVNPAYKPLVQLPWCCLPCALLWVLHRRGYWVDQEEIAKLFDVGIPKGVAHRFTRRMRIAKKPKDTGVGETDVAGLMNRLFKQKKIPLVAERHVVSSVKSPKKFVTEHLKAGHDLIVNISCRPFPKYKSRGGHGCVIAGINHSTGIVTLGDPGGRMPTFWKVHVSKLADAMLPKHGRERGFWVIKSKKK